MHRRHLCAFVGIKAHIWLQPQSRLNNKKQEKKKTTQIKIRQHLQDVQLLQG